MSEIDEPVLGSSAPRLDSVTEQKVEAQIRRLVDSQDYAVLCTQAQEQPYGGLVAFAFSTNLAQAAFAMPQTTRKYHQLLSCPQISLVIDDRSIRGAELMEIEAVTATGRATRVEVGLEKEAWQERLSERHGHLRRFFGSASCALFLVDVVRFFHVVRFQEVSEWVPDQTG
jgi:nitroimidazol reductase NimA-like FMN-containing flavoprotein (pyridoxamine 5'-phosphate oxidase superfamily)